jgi:hypothetical protein
VASEPYITSNGKKLLRMSLSDDSSEKTLSLALFDEKLFNIAKEGDTVRVEYALYERNEPYHNITIGRYGKFYAKKLRKNENTIPEIARK